MHAPSRFSRRPPLWFLATLAFTILPAQGNQLIDYRSAVEHLEQLIRAELEQGRISGVSVALVEDQRVIHVQGYGWADKAKRIPASGGTVYRAGSISKLFTALAVMQLAEQGRLDIDAPVARYAPEFQIIDPFDDAKPVTLRQLMCHRSGLIRESPVGSYFDPSEPGTERTVASLSSCVLVHPPGTRTKYSNSGVTVAGWAVSKVTGADFAADQQERWFGPLGMTNSSFLASAKVRARLASGHLPVAGTNGGFEEIAAPRFELGTLPAGNLYTTAEDLARFLMFLFAEGRAAGQALMQPATLKEMFSPQLTTAGTGFGLGFHVSRFRNHKAVSHTGAVYGFTSSIMGLPEQKLGAVILCNDDIAVGSVRKLNDAALNGLLAAKLGEKPPLKAPRLALAPAALAAFAGEYESESFWARIEAGEGVLQANVSNQRITLTPLEPLMFEANGRLVHEGQFLFERSEQGAVTKFSGAGQTFRRVDPARSQSIPQAWEKFLGRYGPDFIPLIITARHGHLYAMTENEYDYRLTPINQTVFRMPPGLYTDEHLVFQLDQRGEVHGIVLANMPLPKQR